MYTKSSFSDLQIRIIGRLLQTISVILFMLGVVTIFLIRAEHLALTEGQLLMHNIRDWGFVIFALLMGAGGLYVGTNAIEYLTNRHEGNNPPPPPTDIQPEPPQKPPPNPTILPYPPENK